MEKVTPAIQKAANCEVVAIASRGQERAEKASRRLGIASAFGTYQELLDAPDIDAVYIPLPNDLHAEWVIKAAAAGKHVLCEKPIAMSSRESIVMAQACADAGVLLQEAFMYRHHPSWVEAVRLVRSGGIGAIQAVQSWFSYYNDDPRNIRNQIDHGGGATMDIGCYNISLSRLLFDEEPESVSASIRRDPDLGVDIVSSAILSFPGGGQSTFTCSMRSYPFQRVNIVGTDGKIEIEIPFNIPPDVETTITLTSAEGSEILRFPPADQYTIQAELFAAAITGGTEAPVAPVDAIANMVTIEAVLTST
jgi:predicted dehydrogenase